MWLLLGIWGLGLEEIGGWIFKSWEGWERVSWTKELE